MGYEIINIYYHKLKQMYVGLSAEECLFKYMFAKLNRNSTVSKAKSLLFWSML